MPKLNIEGSYRKSGLQFFNNSLPFRLILSNRKPVAGKPSQFFVAKPISGNFHLPDGSTERYISGLFWETNSTGRIDFEGIRYTVEVKPAGMTISRQGGKVL